MRHRPINRQVYLFSLSLAGLLVAFGASVSYLSASPSGRPITYDQLQALAKSGRIVSAEFRDEDATLVGRFTSAQPDVAATPAGPSPIPSTTPAPVVTKRVSQPVPDSEAGVYRLRYPKSDAFTAQLAGQLSDSGARVSVNGQSFKSSLRLFTTFLLPLIILANLFTLLFSLSRGGGSGIGEVISFGSIGKGRQRRGQVAPITFDDVGGAEEALVELREVRDYLADPAKYQEVGAQPPKGVLLFGPPGCGKTLLAKAVAGEAGVPFFSVAGAEFVESLVGVGAARVRDLFARVRAAAPAIVFIDELDAAGRKRSGGGGGSDEREQTLNQILVEMDGFEASAGIVVMGATNRPDILDPALMRPGRFDRHVTVEQPDVAGREQILALHARGKPMSIDVDLSHVARRTPGFTGADLANVVNEAALLTIRDGRSEIEMPEFEEAIQRVLSGPKRRGRMLSPEERKRAAYHESGHCLIAAAAGRLDEIHRVTILARGRTAGATTISADGEAAVLTLSQLQSQLMTTMGGVAAEELVFGEPSSGAEQDLEMASDIARDMVTRYGMSPKLGRLRLAAKAADVYLDGDLVMLPMSGSTHQELELEARRLIDEAESSATQLLAKHRPVLDALAQRLESDETLEGRDLQVMLSSVRPKVTLFSGAARTTTPGDRKPRRPAEVH
jgi:cell division protease FtsH